jgi:hypothetical protein
LGISKSKSEKSSYSDYDNYLDPDTVFKYNLLCKIIERKKVAYSKTFFCRTKSKAQKKATRGSILKNIRPKY